jgi:5-oxoprolinase (ATP-hydrolysing)
MKAVSFDPINLELMWARLINITEEMWSTIWRTAFSLIIGEAQDFGCEILDDRAESLAHSPRSMPVFNLTLPRAVKTLMEFYPAHTLEEGDVLITNDPWVCAGHLYDLAMVTPVFRKGRLVGLVGSIAHCSDIGGTRDSASAREIYEEGLQIPPLKLYRAGRGNSDLFALIERNVRSPERVLGDIQAQLGANRVGASRLLAFMDEYGLESLNELAEVIQGRSERAMREAILAIPDGEYRSALTFDAAGRLINLPIRIVVSGEELLVDYTGAPVQVERGAINCTYSYTTAHTVYALKCLLTPEVPANAGCYRPIRVTAPEGSILNCRYPAAVNLRTSTGWYLAPLIFGALAGVLPERVQAFTGLPAAISAYGSESNGRVFNDHLFQGGGQGASAWGDGKSGLLFPTSAANTPVEWFELRTPLLVEAKELIPDSGGPGRFRGGLGQRVRVRKLYQDGQTVFLGVNPPGLLTQVPGLFGGLPGRRPGVWAAVGGEVREGPEATGLVELKDTADWLTLELGGGSGYGDPLERPLESIEWDLAEGYITEAGLKAYGCQLDRASRPRRMGTSRSSATL